MALQDDVQTALSGMILSASGWRGVFAASGGEEDKTAEIGAGHRIVAAGAGAAFAAYLRSRGGGARPLALVGSDTRPTGGAIADALIRALLASGCDARYAGFVAAPEIMAWARSRDSADGANRAFVYVSASHNPIGHNGLKFGLDDGGVLPPPEAAKLADGFRALMREPDACARLERLVAGADPAAVGEDFSGERAAKKEARAAYLGFADEVAWSGNAGAKKSLAQGIALRPLGVCCDFNGSARCVSIDRDFLGGLGIRFEAMNARAGEIAHRIVPEGESLDPCRAFLEELRSRDPAFVMGYVPDCDGDRGNVVIWDDARGETRALEAQEVFAIACVAELAHLARNSGGLARSKGAPKTAVAINDPTSLRVDRIARAFGAEVFRAEVGEANVVGLARSLREKGYATRILGEGAAGGNITHPSAVRDPLHTVLAIAKLLSLRTEGDKPGLFDLWLEASGQAPLCGGDFGIADVIASLPPFATTGAYAPEALLKIAGADHGTLKSRYQAVFLREWERRKNELKARYGIYGWQAIAYNGMEERKDIRDFGEAGAGGLKILFFDADESAIASLWMRGSATEPVFRIMADAEARLGAERDFIEWQRRMITEADGSGRD